MYVNGGKTSLLTGYWIISLIPFFRWSELTDRAALCPHSDGFSADVWLMRLTWRIIISGPGEGVVY